MIRKQIVCKGSMALFLMSLIFLSPLAYAQLPEKAPVNPALLNWLANKDGEANYGYVPSPLDWSHLTPSTVKAEAPAQFDLRPEGLTSVKDQESCGSCWSHAVCSALESWIKINDSVVFDFSENNMKNNHGFLLDHCDGGNNDIAAAYLARWAGPLLESEDTYNPYQPIPLISTPPPQKLMLESRVFNLNGTDRTEIQDAIMTYGALSAPMYWNATRFNSDTYTYYSTAAANSSNHMIALVGWDDAKTVSGGAPGVGAWICKNSWGTSWGESGYFYISYYDTNIATEGCAAFVKLVNPDSYGTLYQHDPLGLTSYTGWGNPVGYGANVFTALADEAIVAVGTYASADNTAYQITVYDSGISGGNFYNPKSTVSGTFTEAGYYVVDLPTAVNVTSGQRFSIVVRYQTPGWNYPVPLEAPQSGYAAPTAVSGQSYASPDGTGYVDIQSQSGYANTNACIKAIAAAPDKTVRVIAPHWVEEGDPITFSSSLPTLVGTPTFEWYKDEVLIIDADTDTYFIPAATFTDSGIYKLVVTDASKAVMESAPCEVLVLADGSLPVSGMLALGCIVLLLSVSGVCLMVKGRKKCAE